MLCTWFCIAVRDALKMLYEYETLNQQFIANPEKLCDSFEVAF